MLQFSELPYKLFFEGNERQQKELGFKNATEFFENSNFEKFMNDKEIILQALFEVLNADTSCNFKIELLIPFLNSFSSDDLYHCLIKEFIYYIYESDENKKAIFLLSLYNLKFNTRLEVLTFSQILLKLNLSDLIGILNSTKDLINSLLLSNNIDVSSLLKLESFNDLLMRIEINNIKSLNKDLNEFFRFISKLGKNVLKENEIETYTKKYNFKIFEIYLLNFILSKPHISRTQREVLVSKFIISCFESENVIDSDFYEVITTLYKSFHIFVRSKDGCYTIDDYFNLYFIGFKNYDNLPLAINLFNGIFPSFFDVDIENPILNHISDDNFLTIFSHKLHQNCIEETKKCIYALNKRKNIDFISELLTSPSNKYDLDYDTLLFLIDNNFLDYTAINYLQDTYVGKELLYNCFDFNSLHDFEIIKYVYTTYGLDVLPTSYVCNLSSILFKTHNGGYILPLEARKLLFRIMCEASYTNLSLESFINTIFNIFLLDIDSKEFLLDKSEWKYIINTLITENLLSSSKADKVFLRLLSPDEREIMILKKEKEEKERKLRYLITTIKKASTFSDLNSIAYANDFKLLCDNTILKILFDKIYSLMQPKPTYSNFLDFICILYRLYNDKIINSTIVSKFIIKFLKEGSRNDAYTK